MASVTIKQRFLAPKEVVFEQVTPHKMLAEVLPILDIDVVQTSSNGRDGLDSIRAVGVKAFKPLKEQVIAFDAPNRLEYKIVGFMSKFIVHHHGILTFSEDGKNGEYTLMLWHIELKLMPAFMSGIVLAMLKKGISTGLAKKAKLINKQVG